MAVPQTNSDFKTAAEMVWSALDKLSEGNPEEYKKFVDQQLKEGAEIMSPPQPAYCLGCSVIYKGKELEMFLNVCKWQKVPSPKGDTDPVPVKGGLLRNVVEKNKKNSHLLYDVAFNPSVIEECSQQLILQDMLHSLILDFVSDMLNIRLTRQSLHIVTHTNSKGSIEDIQHSLEGNKQLVSQESQLDMRESILEELSRGTLSNNSKLPPLKIKPDQKIQKKLIEELPDPITTKQSYQYSIAHNNDCLVVTVNLPGVNTANDIDLDISEDDILLMVKDDVDKRLNIHLPKPIDTDTVGAKLNTSKSELVITLSLKQV